MAIEGPIGQPEVPSERDRDGPAEPGVCLIAGAGGRIGSALAKQLVATECQVLGVARSQASLDRVRVLGDSVETCLADITDDRSVATIREAIGPRSVRMVVNAARLSEAGGVLEVDVSRLSKAVELKVGGMLRMFRAATDNLQAGSRLIALGGRLGYDPDASAPVASVGNAAVASLIRQLSQLLGPRGVTTHVIAPGAVDEGEREGYTPERSPEQRQLLARSTALGRLPAADDVACVIMLLLHESADFLTGGTLFVDAGRRTAIP